MRIERLAAEQNTSIRWRPFLLGPIFAAQGWTTSPFNIYEAKGHYMWRDMARLCAERGLPLIHPDPFPQHTVRAARLALVVEKEQPEQMGAFCRFVFDAQFTESADVSDPHVLSALLERCGLSGSFMQDAGSPEIKQALRAQTDAATEWGIFGAPSFTCQGELFWGDDRLYQVLHLARG